MHYYLYQIKNKINNKIYVGVHKTKDLNDGYMGSGKIIRLAIEKYGIENFEKTILETFETQEAMFQREKEVVNEEFLNREDTYNLRRGGNGGFDHMIKTGRWGPNLKIGIPLSKDHIEKVLKTKRERDALGLYEESKKNLSERLKLNNPMHNKEIVEKLKKALTGKTKTVEHKNALSKSLMGKTKGRKYPNRKKRDQIKFESVTCPHCNKEGKKNAMYRWHFDNCKNKLG